MTTLNTCLYRGPHLGHKADNNQRSHTLFHSWAQRGKTVLAMHGQFMGRFVDLMFMRCDGAYE